MEKKLIVFDFDKTLIDKDSTFGFFKFCSQIKSFSYFYYIIKLFSMMGWITVKKEKEIGLFLFCPKKFNEFHKLAELYVEKIKLNSIYYNYYLKYLDGKYQVVIASGSFSVYLKLLFPEAIVYGTELNLDENGNINGVSQHPYKYEKMNLLVKDNYHEIECFFTDSKKDKYTASLAKNIYWVKKGKVLNHVEHPNF